MNKKYKVRITKCYYIAIEDKDGYEVADQLCFLDYRQAKKEAEEFLQDWIEAEKRVEILGKYNEYLPNGIVEMREK